MATPSTNRRAFLRSAGVVSAALAAVPAGAATAALGLNMPEGHIQDRGVGAFASSPLMEKIKAFEALYQFGEQMPDETDEDDAAFERHVANLDVAMYDALSTAPATREEAIAYADFVMRPEVFGSSMADPADLALMMGRISDFLRKA